MKRHTPAHIPQRSTLTTATTTNSYNTTHVQQTPPSFSGSLARSRAELPVIESPTTVLSKQTSSNSYKEAEETDEEPLIVAVAKKKSTTQPLDGQQQQGTLNKSRRARSSAAAFFWSRWSQHWSQLKPSTAACVSAFLLLSTTCSLCSASLCDPQSWWDPYKDKCIPCTVCQGDMIPLRPCQMHRDTVCGSIYDLKIDWVVLAKTEPNWKERRKFDGSDYGLDHHQLTAEQLQQLQDETDPMDWQTAALFLAVLACLLFFIVAACILVHHMRQWRRMERRLDQDVEELSTKLMAKLAEVQSLEGGTFFIGNADALRIQPSAPALQTTVAAFHQPQHVMLPEKSDKHHNLHLHSGQLGGQHHHLQSPHDRHLFNTTTTNTLKSGNVYIEDGNGTGSKC
ncbi:tumor necrosis factor receptor superfamily member wengen [Musca domestica]|uniref:Tumor necrosis factor receptor superfamily member wengen n=1 Tax=Musca domestica TaxID=7370 RepID=A0ABM3UW05_MUSDO|nr:tumor necrosis factor receptor superfamily member wengen [Musca domestica]XP_058977712.1 tumor necrosis factor receptor superfamily member wengen [Musca domestica]